MHLPLQLVPLLAGLAYAKCAADNCARAVTGTRRGDEFQTTAKSACSSFMQDTVTVPVTTVTVTATTAVAAAAESQPTTSKTVPSFASACSGAARYASACSCWGITSTTVTVSEGTAYVTVTTTSTSSSAPTQTGPGYNPSTPTSYAGCQYDPASGGPFELLSPNALPLVNKNSKIAEATEVSDTLDPWSFVAPAGAPAGVYDLVLTSGGKSLFFAIFKSGAVGLVDTGSSEGQKWVPSGSDSYITTVWSVQCDGVTTAGIIGGEQFSFAINDNGEVVLSNQGALKTRDIPVPKGFYVYPKNPPAPLNGPRCPNAQHAAFKSPPTTPTANGCGTDTGAGYFVPELDFHDCCDGHDFCYDDCSKGFGPCNDVFHTCMLNKCTAEYGSSGIKHWACEKAANTYYYAVSSSKGVDAFNAATKDYCDCKCDDATKTACEDKCVDAKNDPENCGSCFFHCPTGKCTNGACSFNSCTGQTCSTFGPCGPGGSCVCASITGGTGFCVDGNTPCSGLADCADSSGCPLGSVCAVGTCCGRNVCITTDQCGGFQSSPKMFFGRSWENGTIASKGTWVE
ncbi:phospholipase A2 [Diplogelasinospora grovesii]|uniref:Phospholipase A2 n=1 Tax=Diplogelasinospora grovesii TaxID=303347 RepID=A0AAN6S266_9PEZI|nr:phospholipase A2 [Diplogelasinospora grovesii]